MKWINRIDGGLYQSGIDILIPTVGKDINVFYKRKLLLYPRIS
jgi:hypothetical protein